MARYWRLVNLLTESGALSLSDVMLYDGTTKIVTIASSTVAPVSGALTLLDDGLADVAVSWARCSDPGFAVVLDAGVSYAGVGLRLGSGASAADYPRDLTLQTSADLINWSTQVSYVHATWPGAFSLTPAVGSGGVDTSNYASVSLLLSGGGVENSTTFTDSSLYGTAVTPFGGPVISTTQSKFGGSSMSFSAGKYLNIPDADIFRFGSGDFTIEYFVYPTAVDRACVLGKGNAATLEGSSFSLNHNASFDFYHSGASVVSIVVGAMTLNQWAHYAVVRMGGNISVYRDGVLVGGGTIGSASVNPTLGESLRVGNYVTGAPATGLVGYMDELRITKGTARYTSAFTPPTAAFPNAVVLGAAGDPNYSSVSLLLAGNGANGSTTFTDSSQAPKSVTAFGNAQISTAQSKFGGSSMYFDGVGDYLSLPNNTAFDISSGDFTIEAWVWKAPDSNGGFCSMRLDGATGWCVSIGAGGNISWDAVLGGSWSPDFNNSPAGSIVSSQWSHLALVRHSGTHRTYVDGVLKATATAGGPAFTPQPLLIGVNTVATLEKPFKGYIDDFRFTKGVARYTTNFTPPAAAFSINGLGDAVGSGFTVDSPLPHRLRLSAPRPDLYLPAVPLPDGAASVGLREQTFADIYHGGTGTVSGTVKEKNSPVNTPLHRRVLLIDEASRLVIRETWSDAATGAFSFVGVSTALKYSTVSYDHLNNYRAVIADNQVAT